MPGATPIVRTSSAPPPSMPSSPPAFSGNHPIRPPAQPSKQPVSVAHLSNAYPQPRHTQPANHHPHHHQHQSQPQVSPQAFGRTGPSETQRPSTSPGRSQTGPPGHLPPGAMPPVENNWTGHSISRGLQSPARTSSPPQSADLGYNQRPRTSRSPPPHHYQNHEAQGLSSSTGARVPTRSLSATANPVLPPQHNGVLKKKPASANATSPDWKFRQRETPSAGGEEEDVPLALWQQQQHRRR